jgi:L-lactate dehydrogenase complex protein LldF
MGIEKLLPKKEHLGVFIRLLTRSATGQPITIYTSHYRKPKPGKEMHLVIVDNGRTRQLASDDFRSSLKCIRCAACFNTCPVYRRSGGHSYDAVVAGPIGSILSPNYDPKKHADLPFASTLCGSCSNVCPVKIDIHDQLWKWRQTLTQQGYTPASKTLMMRVMAFMLGHRGAYAIAGKIGRWTLRQFPQLIRNRWNPWYRQREMPDAPKESFQEWFKKHQKI